MIPSTVRPHTVATIGHPANKRVIVKTAHGFWRDVETGEVVDEEDFRAGWQPLVDVADLGPAPTFEVGLGRPDLERLHQVYQELARLPVDEVRYHLRHWLIAREEQKPHTVQIEGEYGTTDGSIHILRDGAEVVMWDSAEWVEDPSLMYVIANAIIGKVPEPEPERKWSPGDSCQLIGNYRVRHIEPCADGHKTGVVTDVRTGEIVERP